MNRLQDMKYRVQTVANPETLLNHAQQEKPLLVVVDLVAGNNNVLTAIAALKKDSATQHIPVVAFIEVNAAQVEKSALEAGATLVVAKTAILDQLAQIIEQALQVF